MIFKRLYKAIRHLKSLLATSDFLEDRQSLEQQLSALMDLYTFLHSFKWLSHDKYKLKVKYYLEHDFDVKASAKHFGFTRVNAFESSISYAAKKFEQAIGRGTLDLILSGDVTSAILLFKVSSGALSLNSLVFDDMVALLPAHSPDPLTVLAECQSELDFFRDICKLRLERRLRTLSQSKLALIRGILESTDPSQAKLREYLYSFMLGNIESLDSLFQLLDSEELLGSH